VGKAKGQEHPSFFHSKHLVLQGVQAFLKTYLSNEVWTLMGRTYLHSALANVGTAELRPFKPVSPEGAGFHAPSFKQTCRAFDGKFAAQCSAGAACTFVHANWRVWA
jgi:hypothetical protein